MMGRRSEQWSLFYQFRLDERVPKDHLLRRIDRFVTASLADIHERLEPHYSEIGRPSVDPELMIRMLIVGYCYGLRAERRLTQEVELHLAYRWFCRPISMQGSSSLDVFGKPAASVSGERRLSSHIRARRCDLHGGRTGQGRGSCGRCQRDGSQRQPLSWQGAGRDCSGPNANVRRAP